MKYEDLVKMKNEVYSFAENVEKKRMWTAERKELNKVMQTLLEYGEKLDLEYTEEIKTFDKYKKKLESIGVMRYD
jgi:hypothetical protein